MSEGDRRVQPGNGGGSAPRLWPWIVVFMMAALAVWFAVTVVERSGPPVRGEPGAPPAAATDTSRSSHGPVVGAWAVLSAMARPGDPGPEGPD